MCLDSIYAQDVLIVFLQFKFFLRKQINRQMCAERYKMSSGFGFALFNRHLH